MMCNGKILIGSPICQDPIILHAFFRSLRRLKIPDYEVFFHFIDDNHNPLSKEFLADFKNTMGNVTIESPSNEMDSTLYFNHSWNHEKIWKVAFYKDNMIDRARREGFDYLFLIDSDILLYPQTVEHLINREKDVIAEIFWTKWTEKAVEQPQVWISDFYNQFEMLPGEKLTEKEEKSRTFDFFNKLRVPGVYSVGGLGACTLISREAIEKGVSFKRIDNLTFWGEDRHFCVRANVLGVDLFVDTQYPAYHVFRRSELLDGLNFLNETSLDTVV